jgi:hypothetical protein
MIDNFPVTPAGELMLHTVPSIELPELTAEEAKHHHPLGEAYSNPAHFSHPTTFHNDHTYGRTRNSRNTFYVSADDLLRTAMEGKTKMDMRLLSALAFANAHMSFDLPHHASNGGRKLDDALGAFQSEQVPAKIVMVHTRLNIAYALAQTAEGLQLVRVEAGRGGKAPGMVFPTRKQDGALLMLDQWRPIVHGGRGATLREVPAGYDGAMKELQQEAGANVVADMQFLPIGESDPPFEAYGIDARRAKVDAVLKEQQPDATEEGMLSKPKWTDWIRYQVMLGKTNAAGVLGADGRTIGFSQFLAMHDAHLAGTGVIGGGYVLVQDPFAHREKIGYGITMPRYKDGHEVRRFTKTA